MEHGLPDVMQQEIRDAMKNMGRAIRRLGALPSLERKVMEEAILLVCWRWNELTEILDFEEIDEEVNEADDESDRDVGVTLAVLKEACEKSASAAQKPTAEGK